MQKIPASVVILSFNSEKTIANAVNSVVMFEDIVVVDSGSSDSTLSILDKLPVKVIAHPWEGYAKQRNIASSHCQHDWVFHLDSDEVADEVLISSIAEIVESNLASGIRMRIRECFMGIMNAERTKQSIKIRMFKRSYGQYEEVKVHEGVRLDGEVVDSRGAIVHYGEYDIARKINKINLYSSLKAEEKSERGQHFELSYLLLIFPLVFIKSYFIRRQFLNGKRGFIAAMCNAFYAFLKQAKLYEAEDKKSQLCHKLPSGK